MFNLVQVLTRSRKMARSVADVIERVVDDIEATTDSEDPYSPSAEEESGASP